MREPDTRRPRLRPMALMMVVLLIAAVTAVRVDVDSQRNGDERPGVVTGTIGDGECAQSDENADASGRRRVAVADRTSPEAPRPRWSSVLASVAPDESLFNGDTLSGSDYLVQTSGDGNRVADVADPAGSDEKVIEVRTDESSGDGRIVRAQLLSPTDFKAGDEYWQVSRIFVDDDLPTNGEWLTLMSSFGRPFQGTSPTPIQIAGNELIWQANGRRLPQCRPWRVPLVKGRWIAVARHEKLSPDRSEGFFEIAYSPDAERVPMTLQRLSNGRTRWNFATIDDGNREGPINPRIANYHKDEQAGWKGDYSVFFARHRVWPAGTSLEELNEVYTAPDR